MTSKDSLVWYLADGVTALPPTQHIVWAGKNLLPQGHRLSHTSTPGDGKTRYMFHRPMGPNDMGDPYTLRLGDRSAWNHIRMHLRSATTAVDATNG